MKILVVVISPLLTSWTSSLIVYASLSSNGRSYLGKREHPSNIWMEFENSLLHSVKREQEARARASLDQGFQRGAGSLGCQDHLLVVPEGICPCSNQEQGQQLLTIPGNIHSGSVAFLIDIHPLWECLDPRPRARKAPRIKSGV